MANRILVLLSLLFSVTACQQQSDRLSEEFLNPPEETKPWVYWYWVDENISREGITKDLEAMASVGIGQALIGHISPGSVRGKTKILSREWWDMVAFAVKEGERTGVDIGFFNGPGWSQSGGPWIKPDQAMRHVASTELVVRGPRSFRQKLPQPGPGFTPIAVQAFRIDTTLTPRSRSQKMTVKSFPETRQLANITDGDTATSYPVSQGVDKKIILEFQSTGAATIRTLKFSYLPVPIYTDVTFEAADDRGQFHAVRRFTLDRRNINFQIGPKRFEPVMFSVPVTSGRTFRLVLDNIKASSGAGFTEIELLAKASVDQHIDKQLGKMASDPLPPWDAYLWPDQAEPGDAHVVNPGEVINLTSQVDSSGVLRWEIPEGTWTILNSGMIPTGAVNVPVPPEATGYECDKFSKDATQTHFNAFIGKFLRDVPEEDRRALKTVVIDSYEVGSQNWSNEFAATFQEEYGYDPLPWLPVFTGRVVKSADLSNRFLWDVRRLTADLIAENYVKTFRELCNKNGLDLWVENYGHWGFPAEFLQYGGQADMVSGEFWFENPFWDLGPSESRGASSAAHIYGKNKVFAEAFTAGFNFKQYPGSMKRRGDRMFCEGINHFVLHLYIHQPWNDRKPGVTAWFGMSFQRNNTWFAQSKAWIDYLRRCHHMLEQGTPVTDVCYFIGEDAPKMTGVLTPELPAGYDYDFINAEVLERAEVNNGSIVLPNGKTYRLLVLPPLKTMRPALLRKIEKLISGGAIVYGPAPARSPGMKGYPQSDDTVASLSRRIWDAPRPGQPVNRKYGNGRIFDGLDLARVLSEISLAPDVIASDTAIMWTHRGAKDVDIYFISNQSEREITSTISFRINNKVPELWYPDTGHMTEASSYTHEKERTVMPITLEPGGSRFIVFRKEGSTKGAGSVGDSKVARREIGVTNPWQLYFPKGWDTPDSVRLEHLVSWTALTDPGAKYFSGTATYRNVFEIPEEAPNDSTKVFLDLGGVMMMAEVIVNGNNLGVLWKSPYKLEITKALKTGINQLEIRVTNTWWNRLVGDEMYPDGFPGSEIDSARTFATVKNWSANDALMDAGLLGPVKIILESK